MQTLIAVLAPVLTFFAVLLAAIGLYLWTMTRRDRIQRRLEDIDRNPSHHAAHEEGSFAVKWLDPPVGLILPQEEWSKSPLKRQLVAAGYRGSRSVTIYLGAKLLGALLLSLILLVLLAARQGTIYLLTPATLALALLAAAIGFFVPDQVLRMRTSARRREFIEGFPDALDMLVVCVEAGLGLDAAIDRVAREIRVSHPALSMEIALIALEIRVGKSRAEALRSLADRLNLDQARSLATLLIQAEKYGTSIGAALRTFAGEMRTERLQRARELGAKLSVKLTLPLMLFIFPALFLVVLGPAVVRIYTVFLS